MDFPPIMPDEWLASYRARTAHLNCATTQPRFSRMCTELYDRLSLPIAERPKSPFPHLAAHVLGQNLEDLVRHHTMWPLARAFPLAQHHPIRLTPQSSCIWNRPMRAGLALCPHCIESDLNKYYFSYVRRSHQMPGRQKCLIHDTHLFLTENSIISLQNPEAAIMEAQKKGDCDTQSYSDHPAVSRTVRLLDLILNSSSTPSTEIVRDRIRQQILNATSSDNIKLATQRFGDEMFAALPPTWIKKLIPKISYRQKQSHAALVQSVVNKTVQMVSATSVAVMASLLYKDIQSAESALMSTG